MILSSLLVILLPILTTGQPPVRSRPVVIRLQPDRNRPQFGEKPQPRGRGDNNGRAVPSFLLPDRFRSRPRPAGARATLPDKFSRLRPRPLTEATEPPTVATEPVPTAPPQPIVPVTNPPVPQQPLGPQQPLVPQQPGPQQPLGPQQPGPPKLPKIPPGVAKLLGLDTLFPGLIQTQTSAQFPSLPNVNSNQGLLGQFGSSPNLPSAFGSNGIPGLTPDLISKLSGIQGGGGGLSGFNSGGSALSGLGGPGVGGTGFPGLGNLGNFGGSGLTGGGDFGTSPNSGLLGILGKVTRQLTQATGVRDILSQARGSGLTGFIPGLANPGRGPPVAGLPRLPGISLLPGGIPRNAQGQVDVVNLLSAITRRVSNGTTLSDVLPPSQLQKFADNVTHVLLPKMPDIDLTKFMGRWFEGINSPRASEQRCVVHHYGGLTDNGKTSTFTALKIYREGSEFGQVRYSIGYAFRGGHRNAMLQMHTSESTDSIPYWIYMIGPEGEDPFGNPQYEYAVISNWVKYPVTVLVRDPDTFKEKYEEEVLRTLEESGFINGFIRAFNLLQPASYKNCQYADSTFQVFGS